jgi:hypothetical protein
MALPGGATAHEATQDCTASGWGCAIRNGAKNTCVMHEEAVRIAAEGAEVACFCDHQMPDGSNRIVTRPVN